MFVRAWVWEGEIIVHATCYTRCTCCTLLRCQVHPPAKIDHPTSTTLRRRCIAQTLHAAAPLHHCATTFPAPPRGRPDRQSLTYLNLPG